jgi:hypothetical protein
MSSLCSADPWVGSPDRFGRRQEQGRDAELAELVHEVARGVEGQDDEVRVHGARRLEDPQLRDSAGFRVPTGLR